MRHQSGLFCLRSLEPLESRLPQALDHLGGIQPGGALP